MSGTEPGGIERVVEGTSPDAMFAEHLARYRFAASEVKGHRVLDLACGSGYGSRFLKDAGALEVVGVDRDPDIVTYARERYGAPGVTYLAGDALSPPVTGPFGAVVSFETIEHLDDAEGFCRVCREILRPGGLFIVSTPYRARMKADGSPVNPFHRREWRPDEFETLLQRDFAPIILYGQSVALRKRPLQLSRSLARPLSRARGFRLGDPEHIFRLPGPGFLGFWDPYPVFLIAVCRSREKPVP